MNYHGGTATQRKLVHEEITELVIGAAIEVAHSPGTIGYAYEESDFLSVSAVNDA